MTIKEVCKYGKLVYFDSLFAVTSSYMYTKSCHSKSCISKKKKRWLCPAEYSSNRYVVNRIQEPPFYTSKTGSSHLFMLISVGSKLAKINKLYVAGFREALLYPKSLRLSFSYMLHKCIKNE
jgi:hypothetical protein